jgi:hypothetical protein
MLHFLRPKGRAHPSVYDNHGQHHITDQNGDRRMMMDWQSPLLFLSEQTRLSEFSVLTVIYVRLIVLLVSIRQDIADDRRRGPTQKVISHASKSPPWSEDRPSRESPVTRRRDQDLL